jgi:hypothetical protein
MPTDESLIRFLSSGPVKERARVGGWSTLSCPNGLRLVSFASTGFGFIDLLISTDGGSTRVSCTAGVKLVEFQRFADASDFESLCQLQIPQMEYVVYSNCATCSFVELDNLLLDGLCGSCLF